MLYGFDIGGTKIEMSVFDNNIHSLWSKRVATPLDSYQNFLHCIVNLVAEADKKFLQQGAVGIGIPGFIDQQKRTVYATNIEVIKNKPLVEELENMINRPVLINNDANCFTLSEAHYPDFKEYHNILGLILGTGVGGSLVINQQIVSGANGCCGEIGHIRLPIDALAILGRDIPIIACNCGGVGCSEHYLSGTGFEWLYTHFYHQTLTAQAIIANYYRGDDNAKQHVERYMQLLAAYLGHLIMIIDPDLIVIGGGLSNFDMLYQVLPKYIKKYVLPNIVIPKIVKAKYGDSGGSRGAALLCVNH